LHGKQDITLVTLQFLVNKVVFFHDNRVQIDQFSYTLRQGDIHEFRVESLLADGVEEEVCMVLHGRWVICECPRCKEKKQFGGMKCFVKG